MRLLRPTAVVLTALLSLSAAACDSDDGRSLAPPSEEQRDVFAANPRVTSTTGGVADVGFDPLAPLGFSAPEFGEDIVVPDRFACESGSPSLVWSNQPPSAVEMAIVVLDLDATDPELSVDDNNDDADSDADAGSDGGSDGSAPAEEDRDDSRPDETVDEGNDPDEAEGTDGDLDPRDLDALVDGEAIGLDHLDGGHAVHWLITGLEPGSGGIEAGAPPVGAPEAVNSQGSVGWFGPCPPAGDEHRYRFLLYPLPRRLDVDSGLPTDEALEALRLGLRDAPAPATFVATYTRPADDASDDDSGSGGTADDATTNSDSGD